MPSHLNTQYILDAIPPHQDVDVLSSPLLGKFYTGKSLINPPVVEAVLKVFASHDIKVKSRSVVIVGAGRLVGKPLLISLLDKGATVSILNQFTSPRKFKYYTLNADIVISGTGKSNLLNADMFRKGAIVIDAGMRAKIIKGKTIIEGDINQKGLEKKVSIFVSARQGLGPITVAMLMSNLVRLKIHKKAL